MLLRIRSGNEKQWNNPQAVLPDKVADPSVVPPESCTRQLARSMMPAKKKARTMNSERTLLTSILFLLLGLGLIFGYCHGTVGFSAAYPVSGTSLQVAINSTGFA